MARQVLNNASAKSLLNTEPDLTDQMLIREIYVCIESLLCMKGMTGLMRYIYWNDYLTWFQAQEYAKNIPKPKVVPKSKNPTPAPTANLPSARSLSKLNDISTDRQQQLTYRAADKPQSNANYTNHQTVGFPLQSAGISHSFSSPILSQLAGGYGDATPGAELPDQFGYVYAI